MVGTSGGGRSPSGGRPADARSLSTRFRFASLCRNDSSLSTSVFTRRLKRRVPYLRIFPCFVQEARAGFTPMPWAFLGVLAAILALYVLAAELAKRAFYRRPRV